MRPSPHGFATETSGSEGAAAGSNCLTAPLLIVLCVCRLCSRSAQQLLLRVDCRMGFTYRPPSTHLDVVRALVGGCCLLLLCVGACVANPVCTNAAACFDDPAQLGFCCPTGTFQPLGSTAASSACSTAQQCGSVAHIATWSEKECVRTDAATVSYTPVQLSADSFSSSVTCGFSANLNGASGNYWRLQCGSTQWTFTQYATQSDCTAYNTNSVVIGQTYGDVNDQSCFNVAGGSISVVCPGSVVPQAASIDTIDMHMEDVIGPAPTRVFEDASWGRWSDLECSAGSSSMRALTNNNCEAFSFVLSGTLTKRTWYSRITCADKSSTADWTASIYSSSGCAANLIDTISGSGRSCREVGGMLSIAVDCSNTLQNRYLNYLAPENGYIAWGACSVTCGGGVQVSTCVPPKYGGAPCPTSDVSQRACNTDACPAVVPINGGWTDFGECSASCSQTRTCTNPAPANGGADCSGAASQACNTDACSSDATASSTGGSDTGADGAPSESSTGSGRSSATSQASLQPMSFFLLILSAAIHF